MGTFDTRSIEKNIYEKMQMRYTKKEKGVFCDYIMCIASNAGKAASVDKAGNIIIGAPGSSKMIITVHYDTAAVRLIPNTIRMKAFNPGSLIQLVPLLILFFIYFFIQKRLNSLLPQIIFLVVFLCAILTYAAYLFNLFGISNEHTANDNTSGVIALIRLYGMLMKRDDIAFVLFNNEEKGLCGSGAFAKRYPLAKVINLDCVAAGNIFYIYMTEDFISLYRNSIKELYSDDSDYRVTLTSSENHEELGIIKGKNIASDSKKFKCSAGIIATDENGLVYNLHTSKDTSFNWDNIDYVANIVCNFIEKAVL